MRISQTGQEKYAIVITVPVIVSLFGLFSELDFGVITYQGKTIV